MEFKKKTIIWEDNNEPPKSYIWAKKDGKFYEYDYNVRDWVESTSINSSGSGSSSDVESFINAVSNFSIKIKKDKSGFFSESGEPVNNLVYASPYYATSHQPEELGKLTSIEEYFDISNMDVFVGLCNLVKKCDNIECDSGSEENDNHVTIRLDKSDLLGEFSNIGRVIIGRTGGWIQDDVEHRDECVCIHHYEYGDASTYYPDIHIYLDPSDPTKFYAKPEQEQSPEKSSDPDIL